MPAQVSPKSRSIHYIVPPDSQTRQPTDTSHPLPPTSLAPVANIHPINNLEHRRPGLSPRPCFCLISTSLHVNSKSHSANNSRSQSRQFPPDTSIISLLDRSIGRSRSRSVIARAGRAGRSSSHQSSRHKAGSLRQLAVNRSLGFDAGSERHDRAQSCRSLVIVVASARLGIRLSRVENRVDDVEDAVRDQDVGVDDAGVVDEHGALLVDGDGQLFARESREAGVVAEGGAVAYGALHNVILQDLGQLLVGDVGSGCGELLEGVVVWAEDRHVRELFEGCNEVCCGCGAGECGEVAGDQSGGDAERDQEEFVDDVDDAVVEFDVLVFPC